MSDLISRADIPYHKQLEPMGNGQYVEVEVAYKDDIDALPSAEPKTGHWINTAPSYRSDNIVCDQCRYDSIARYDYCPNCGARMKGADDE